MKAIDEKIEIHNNATDARGNRLEPEEQPVVESFVTKMDVTLGTSHRAAIEEASVHAIPIRVNDQMSAIDLARAHGTRCELCLHFRNQDWLKIKQSMAGTVEGRAVLDKMRAELLGSKDTLAEDYKQIDHDVEHVLGTVGVCAAWTEEFREIHLSTPDGGCPESQIRFTARDESARRVASLVYDATLRAASRR